ncbi:TetR/AcrR family transcriptional regulator [Winogradskyella sp. A3E31]|uniref:TetR/AcrR family transcriptional regulator n=1 Tax=Winogradskyella sp. A3E31 TaxID=3349637 RepID=UPI00398BA1D9
MSLIKTKKDLFYDEVLKLFYEKGYSATTMRDIADRMGFKVSNVYNYIDNKQSMLSIIMTNIAYEFHNSLEDIVNSSYSPEEKLKQILSSHIKIIAKKPYEIALTINEYKNLEEPRLTEILAIRKNYSHHIREILKEGITLGQFRPLDVYVASNTILSALRWLYDKYTNPNSKSNPIEVEKEFIDFIFGGLRKQ